MLNPKNQVSAFSNDQVATVYILVMSYHPYIRIKLPFVSFQEENKWQ